MHNIKITKKNDSDSVCSPETEQNTIKRNSKQNYTQDTMTCDEKQHREKSWKKDRSVKLEQKIIDFNIDENMFEDLTFRENLVVSIITNTSKIPIPVGGLSLDIQKARGGPLKNSDEKKTDDVSPKFLVHLTSHFDHLGYNAGSNILAWIDRDLQTLEENRKEFLKKEIVEQQTLYINRQKTFYYLRHNKKTDKALSYDQAKDLICEGANLVLMRFLAVTKFMGTFETSTLYINGDLCRNIYECKGPRSAIVNDTKLDVCKIYRIIIEECGIKHTSSSLLTLQGQILRQEWDSCNYILQVNPLANISNVKGSNFGKIPLIHKFEEDIELLSIYLDNKTVNKKIIANYMKDHPEIIALMSDYVQTILQLKPEDVYDFTAKYFLDFAPGLLPLTEYFDKVDNFVEDEHKEIDWKYI